MKKILLVRFSSIGDIVLTTPIIRCLKEQQPENELHYLTKTAFKDLLCDNPHLSKLHTIERSIQEITATLKTEAYTCIIDLHHNLRTKRLSLSLNIPMYSFPKLNIRKWLFVHFKWDNMPSIHIVERYFEACGPLNIQNDGKPGELFIDAKHIVQIRSWFNNTDPIIGIAIGAQFATKRLPKHKLSKLIGELNANIVLIGGKTDAELGEELCSENTDKRIINACGKYSLQESISIVSQLDTLVTHDTGMMHVAACFNVPIVSVWGNTTPKLGMYPYRGNQPVNYSIHEVQGLSCKPCSKIGFQRCPKKHFNCMEQQDVNGIAQEANRFAKPTN